MNHIYLIGRTGKAPEIKALETGKVAKFSLAVSEKVTRKGEKVEETEWFNLVVFNSLAEVCEKYVKKGDHIAVNGKIKSRKYTDKDGNERTIYEVFVSSLEMLGGKKQEAEPESDLPTEKDIPSERPAPQTNMDDLPF